MTPVAAQWRTPVHHFAFGRGESCGLDREGLWEFEHCLKVHDLLVCGGQVEYTSVVTVVDRPEVLSVIIGDEIKTIKSGRFEIQHVAQVLASTPLLKRLFRSHGIGPAR